MRALSASLVAIVCLGWPALARAQGGAVEERREEWRDPTRDRTVPVKLYLPAAADGPHPVVLLSHGLGGTREGLSYLARHWAARGFFCLVVQHPGSDDGVWRDVPLAGRMRALRAAARDWRAALDRPRDVSFALDRLEAAHADPASPLHGRLDLTRAAIAGHSFGAFTALAAGGRLLVGPGGRTVDLSDRRLRCVVALSGQGSGDLARDRPAFAALRRPTLHMTGTLDDSPVTDVTPAERRVPFDLTPGPADGGAPQYLVVLAGGDHMVFSGERTPGLRSRGDPALDPAFHELIRRVGTAFLEAYLRDDADARAYLDGGGFERDLGAQGTFEAKLAPPGE